MVNRQYEVEITPSAFRRYRFTILTYLKKYFSTKRALEIQSAIEEKVNSLSQLPNRGSKEQYLSQNPKDYRYILHKESRNFIIKIVYFIDEPSKKIYITDFFPTAMNPKEIRG